MSGVIKAASTDQYTAVKMWTAADGLPKTDADHATSGLSIKYQIGNAAVQSVTVAGSPAPASMSAGGAHADWGIYHRGNGWYVIGLADAVLATAGNRVTVWIELTDCDSAPAEIYVAGYDGSQVAVGANTVAPDNAGIAANGVALGNVPSVTQISDRIERVGGPLDSLETSALTGPNTVTVTVTDSVSAAAIQSAIVKVFRAGETESKLTNASGVTTHGLTSNTFTFTTNARGYQSEVRTVVVSGDQAVAVSLTPITVADPGTAGVCRLIAYVFLNDAAVTGATVSARLKSINQATDGIIQSVISANATTNASGLATLDLIQGGEFTDGDGVYVITAKHGRTVIWEIESAMPDAASVNVEDLIPVS